MNATDAQQPSVKDLANRVLERNRHRNNGATTPEMTATVAATKTDAKRLELLRLVPLFTTYCKFSREDVEEALQVALEHPDNALLFYRGKVKQLGIEGRVL